MERRSNPYEVMDAVVRSTDQESSVNTDEGLGKPSPGSHNESQVVTPWYCYSIGKAVLETVEKILKYSGTSSLQYTE